MFLCNAFIFIFPKYCYSKNKSSLDDKKSFRLVRINEMHCLNVVQYRQKRTKSNVTLKPSFCRCFVQITPRPIDGKQLHSPKHAGGGWTAASAPSGTWCRQVDTRVMDRSPFVPLAPYLPPPHSLPPPRSAIGAFLSPPVIRLLSAWSLTLPILCSY